MFQYFRSNFDRKYCNFFVRYRLVARIDRALPGVNSFFRPCCSQDRILSTLVLKVKFESPISLLFRLPYPTVEEYFSDTDFEKFVKPELKIPPSSLMRLF